MIRLKKDELCTVPGHIFGYDEADINRTQYKYLDVVVGHDDIVYIQSLFTWKIDPVKLYTHYLEDNKTLEHWVQFHRSLENHGDVLTCVNFGDYNFGGNLIPMYRAEVRGTKEFGKVLDTLQYLPFSEVPFNIWPSDLTEYFTRCADLFDEFIYVGDNETLPRLHRGRYMIQVLA